MDAFDALFGRPPEVVAAAAGRVNLIGEHTDYNGGWVLPAPIPQTARVELARRDDRCVRVASAAFAAAGIVTYELGAERPRGDWLDYVQGATRVLAGAGLAVPGFDACIGSDVPVGSGVSSSAAVEVALLRALRAAHAMPLDDVQLAQLGQRLENEFVGAQVGIMDQMSASLGQPGMALLIDTRALSYERIRLPPSIELLVIDSGIAHAHATGAYNTRRRECEEACRRLGIVQLRELEPADLLRLQSLPPVLQRRARHVVTENARVLAAADALRRSDGGCFGSLMYASHVSMRDDFEVSVADIDLLVDLAAQQPGVLGARMTGGGFGGCVLIAVGAGTAAAIADNLARQYAHRTGRHPRILVPVPNA